MNQLEILVEQLKKYPFVEKMLLCQQCSTRLMEITHLDILGVSDVVYPWEIEVFAELSLFAEAPIATCSFNGNNSDFVDIINKLRNYHHPILAELEGVDFVNDFMMVSALQQFKAQENIFDRLYRYSFFWDFVNERVNMPQVFAEHFDGLSFSDFRRFGVLVFFYASLKQATADILNCLFAYHERIVRHLSISRESYRQQQSIKINDNYENAFYGFNYLHPYPFVEFNGFYFLPVPYLVIDAITDSMLTRVTYGNNALREVIGKEVAQTYIEKIFGEGNVYDEVLPECTYYIGTNRIDSPDILIRKGAQVCFIDTKLSTPTLEIRKFNSEAIRAAIERYAANMIQMYHRVMDFNERKYNPFRANGEVDAGDVFGIVALLEDSFISRRQIYHQVFQTLGIDEESSEANYIRANIKITNFRDLEMFAFRSHDIFTALTLKRDDSNAWNDMGLFSSGYYREDEQQVLPSVEKNLDWCRDTILKSADVLESLGLIKNDQVI